MSNNSKLYDKHYKTHFFNKDSEEYFDLWMTTYNGLNQTNINVMKLNEEMDEIRKLFFTAYKESSLHSRSIFKEDLVTKNYETLKNQPNETLQLLFNKINSKLEELDDEFEDSSLRLFHFVGLRKILAEAIENLDEFSSDEKYLFRVAIILHDLIKKIKPENITNTQYTMIKSGIQLLTRGNVSRQEFEDLDNLLLDNGLDWIYGD